MSSERPSVVILGAGATGLGSALGVAYNARGAHVLVVERNPTSGGLAGSFRWKDHIIDYGPHRLSPQLPAIRALASELLGPDLLVKRAQHGVHFRRRLYQHPPRVIDFLHPAALAEAFAFAVSFIFAKFAWIVRRFRSDTFESVASRNFGRRFHDKILFPMAKKVWTDPDTIDPLFVNQRMAMIRPFEILKTVVLPSPELNPQAIYYPRQGYQQLWDRMSEALRWEGHDIWWNSQPTRIEVENNKIVRVHLARPSGETVVETSDIPVLSTIPLPILSKLISGMKIENLDERLARIKYRSMLLVAFEFDVARALPYRVLIFPESSVSFNRLFEQNEYSRDTVAPGKSVVVADITLPRGDPLFHASDAEIIARVEADLRRLPYIPSSKIVDRTVKRVEFAYAVPDVESRKTTTELLHELKQISNLHLLGRFAVGEYDNADYAIDNGLLFGAMLAGRISRIEYLCSSYEKRGRNIVL
jgi:protoporphyrinogen oxidase